MTNIQPKTAWTWMVARKFSPKTSCPLDNSPTLGESVWPLLRDNWAPRQKQFCSLAETVYSLLNCKLSVHNVSGAEAKSRFTCFTMGREMQGHTVQLPHGWIVRAGSEVSNHQGAKLSKPRVWIVRKEAVLSQPGAKGPSCLGAKLSGK